MAALALVEGWADPLELLRLDELEFRVACAVLEEASQISAKRRRSLVEALARSIAGQTASRVLRGLGRMFSD